MGLATLVVLLAAGEALACGDKFLVAGRGTRYQRPKNTRAASVLIYADPASELPGRIGKLPLETVLKREGHRSTVAQSLEQVATLVAGGRYDVVLAANSVIETIKGYVGGAPDSPVLVAMCVKGARQVRDALCVKNPAQEGSLLRAIDEAVAQRDRSLRKSQRSG